MKGDFTRLTYNPTRHYSSVRMQQGRVLLDADWNEEIDILKHRIETEAVDVIGACGVPKHSPGFAVTTETSGVSAEDQARLTALGVWPLEAGDFLLGPGRAYVNGALCENEQLITFASQPDLPGTVPIQSGGTYIVYLDVWQRHLTALEDPTIREVALGGPDTATRTKTIWQVKLMKAGEDGSKVSCADAVTWPASGTGMLRARTEPTPPEDNPCVVPPGAGYRRLENQLYRIEIHRGSGDTGGPTFKWSRDNGSVVVAVEAFNANGDPKQVKVKSLGRDDVLGLHKFDRVEILDDASELTGTPGTMTQILNVDTEHRVLTLDASISGYSLDGHARVRRWDSKGELKVEVPGTNDGYIKIEDGVEIKFDLKSFNRGDYWLIPARTVPGQYGDIEWPQDASGDPLAVLPAGIRHHYCKLAVLTASGTGENLAITGVEDCREIFPPLTELPAGGECCCTVSVGDGVHSTGDFADIQTAIDSLPDEGGQVCIQTGIYTLDKPVKLGGRVKIRITGCKNRTLIVGPPSGPVFQIDGGTDVELSLLIVKGASGPAAIVARKVRDLRILQCEVTNIAERDAAGGKAGVMPAIAVVGGIRVEIGNNRIGGDPAVAVLARRLRMHDNVVRGGGVWVRSGSLDVAIERNEISTGPGAGIRLGDAGEEQEIDAKEFVAHSAPDATDPDVRGEATFLRNPAARSYVEYTKGIAGVLIGNNTITRMGGSGITTIVNRVDGQELVENGDIEDLAIVENTVAQCVLFPPDTMLNDRVAVAGGIVLAMVTRAAVRRNVVRDNGTRAGLTPGSTDVKEFPACGIFLLDCAGAEVTGNTVENNGTALVAGAAKQPAFQAGIALLLVFGNNIDLSDLAEKKFDLKAGLPAARVHDNVVSCPAGHALVSVALGSVSVQGNTLTTHDARMQPDLFGGDNQILNLSTTVFVFNLGRSALLSQGLAGFGVNSALVEGIASPSAYPDGRILFSDNQVTFTSPREGAKNLVSAIALWSQDDVSVEDNQVLSQIADGKLTGDCLALGITVRATGNFFNELPATAYASYLSWGLMNAMTGNQGAHCLLALGTRVTEGNNLVAFPSPLCDQFKLAISPKG